jgi:hypothetical protein
MREMFNESQLISKLEKIGNNLKRRIKIFLIGGCSMVLRGNKLATKDIDVVFTSASDIKDFAGVLKDLGFQEIVKLPKDYDALGTSAVFRDAKGFQFDLFHRQVCRGLEITKKMEERAEFYRAFRKLDVYLMAPEDIFLFKSITEREADIIDMRTLAERGLNWDVIKEECISQEKRRIWEYFLVYRLEELESRFGIEAPIMKELWKIGGDKLVKKVFIEIVKDGNGTFGRIHDVIKKKYRYSESWTRRELKRLVEKGVLKVKREKRRLRYIL